MYTLELLEEYLVEAQYRRWDGEDIFHTTLPRSLGDKGMKEAIQKVEEDCPEGKIPIVVFHRRQKIKNGKRIQGSRRLCSIIIRGLPKHSR